MCVIDTHLHTFDHDVLETSSRLPVLVDFWAGWCAPCLAIAPVLESLMPRYSSRILLARLEVDQDENMKLAGRYQVKGFPTIILFARGEEVARFSGMRPARSIESFIRIHTGLTAS